MTRTPRRDRKHGDWLDRLIAEGRQAWPKLALDAQIFRAYLVERADDPDDSKDTMDRGDSESDEGKGKTVGSDRPSSGLTASVADLYLACACLCEVPGAVEAFETTHHGVVTAAIRQIDPSPAFGDDVRQDLATLLFVPQNEGGNKPPKIAQYGGRGPLATWTFVTVLNMARRRKRQSASRAVAEESAMREGLYEALNREGDPQLLPLKKVFATELKAALYTAIDALPTRDRLWLYMNVVRGVAMDRLGAASGASQSKVSRHIRDTKEQILNAAKQHLREQHKLTETECDSLVRLVQSQVDFTLSRVFEGERVGG